MDRTDTEFLDKMITLTAYPEWSDLVSDLKSLIYHMQADAFESGSWDKLNEDKGFAKGLGYIVNFRETVKSARGINDANV